MLLGSAIDYDTRVKKEAVSLQKAGCRVTVISRSAGDAEASISNLDGVTIIRQPVPLVITQFLNHESRAQSLWGWAQKLWREHFSWRRGFDDRTASRIAHWMETRYKAEFAAASAVSSEQGRRLEFEKRVRATKLAARSARSLPRFRWKLAKAHEAVLRWTMDLGWPFDFIVSRSSVRSASLRVMWHRWERRFAGLEHASKRTVRRPRRPGKWETTLPYLVDAEIAFKQHIDRYPPDVIHAHDFFTLPMAVRAKQRAFADGRHVRVVYDSHEYVKGLGGHYPPAIADSYLEMESQYIDSADAVMTVTDDIADRLQETYRLTSRPVVVLNAPPLASGKSESRTTVRNLLGLDLATPLGVYIGNVNPKRGLDVLIEAMASVPRFHVAVVATRADANLLEELESLATHYGVRDRIHFVDPVPPHEVVPFIADADIGLIVIRSDVLNHQVSLPNKLFEYLHAKLVVVTSDCVALERFVLDRKVGEVFHSGKADHLAEALNKVIANPRVYIDRIDNALLAEYSWETSQFHLIELYASVTGRLLDPRPEFPSVLTEEALPVDGGSNPDSPPVGHCDPL